MPENRHREGAAVHEHGDPFSTCAATAGKKNREIATASLRSTAAGYGSILLSLAKARSDISAYEKEH
jgi:hypothetical protein